MADESDALQKIADEFVQILPERLSAIDDAWTRLNVPSPAIDDMQDFYHRIHNLTGSSGTFGFVRFSMIARSILDVLEPCIKGEIPLSPDLVVAVEPPLQDLKREAADPVQEEGWL